MVLPFWVNLLVLSRQRVPEGRGVCQVISSVYEVGGRLQIQPQPQCAIKPPVAKAASTESLFLFTSRMLRNLTVPGEFLLGCICRDESFQFLFSSQT